MSQHMAEDVAPGTDGFDSHVCQCQQKVEGGKKNVRHELYIYCQFFLRDGFQHLFQLRSGYVFVKCQVVHNEPLSSCPYLRCVSVTETRDGSQGPHTASLSTDSHCHILYV